MIKVTMAKGQDYITDNLKKAQDVYRNNPNAISLWSGDTMLKSKETEKPRHRTYKGNNLAVTYIFNPVFSKGPDGFGRSNIWTYLDRMNVR